MARLAEDKDPQADRKAECSQGTFEELAKDYVEQFARRENKSWKQATIWSRNISFHGGEN